MPRQATGTVVEHTAKDGRMLRSLRFTAYGKRHRMPLGAVSDDEARRTLAHVIADVERGVWQPQQAPEPPPEGMPTFHVFAEQWWVEREREWRGSTRERYRECLELHLLPFFGTRPLSAISIADVDGYKASKLRDGHLAPATINKQLILLSSILESAVERYPDELVRNPAHGKRRRVRAQKPRRSYLDTAEQIETLLEAAGQLDAKARADHQHMHRRAMLAVLTFAGLRLGEALQLRWRDVDLAAGRLRVGEAKTDAGRRHVTIRAGLRDELLALRADLPNIDPYAYVFGTSTGKRHGATNVRKRVMATTVERANTLLAERGSATLPDGLTPHSLRRTFASLLYALGEDPPTVMAEMGHTSPALALAIYAQAMRRDAGEKARLRALVDGVELANSGQRAAETVEAASLGEAA